MTIRSHIEAGKHAHHAAHAVGKQHLTEGHKRVEHVHHMSKEKHMSDASHSFHKLPAHSKHSGVASGHFSGEEKEKHMYGVREHIISHTKGNPSPVMFNSQNLMNLVHNTVGHAAQLVHHQTHPTKGIHVKDSTEKGSGGIGHVTTQPASYGQVPFVGRHY